MNARALDARRRPVKAIAMSLLAAVILALASPPTTAAMNSGVSESEAAEETDYAKGRAAFDRGDWTSVVAHMNAAVRREPWHDDAFNALGYAYRQLGDYGRALSAYHRALQLNPYHREALEYLGEAYLELGQPGRALEVLERLRQVCNRGASTGRAAAAALDCEEWVELNEAIEARAKAAPK